MARSSRLKILMAIAVLGSHTLLAWAPQRHPQRGQFPPSRGGSASGCRGSWTRSCGAVDEMPKGSTRSHRASSSLPPRARCAVPLRVGTQAEALLPAGIGPCCTSRGSRQAAQPSFCVFIKKKTKKQQNKQKPQRQRTNFTEATLRGQAPAVPPTLQPLGHPCTASPAAGHHMGP